VRDAIGFLVRETPARSLTGFASSRAQLTRRFERATLINVGRPQPSARQVIGRGAPLLIAIVAVGCSRGSSEREPTPEPPGDARPIDRAQARGENMLTFAAACHEPEVARESAACRHACDLGHSNSCGRLGEHYRLAGDTAQARRWFEHACKGGSGVGCQGAAELAPHADKAEWFVKARQYHRVHCDQDYAPSCLALARLHEAGLGGPADRGVAAHYLQRACALGENAGCRQ